MNALAALRLQLEWGCDEALEPNALNRLRPPGSDVPSGSDVLEKSAAPLQVATRASEPPEATASPELVLRARAAATAAHSEEELRAAIENFDPDGLAATATAMVFSDGRPAYGLVLVGDVPGADEDRLGVPLSGRAGQLLDRMLATVGIDRTQVLLTAVLPWRPPGGRPASELELACHHPFLMRHLTLLRPRLAMALGAAATRALLGRSASLARVRGRWVEAALPDLETPLRVLPTLHPEQLLTRPELKQAAWEDLRLLRRTLNDMRNT